MEIENLKDAMNNKTILKGKVIYERENKTEEGKEKEIVVDCEGIPIFIKEDDCQKFLFAKTIISLIGEDIEFVLISADFDNNIFYGSMKEAEDIKLKPIIETLEKGEVADAIVINTTVHGAYMYINGVHGFMRNLDFSDDGTAVRDVYSRLDTVKVKFLKYSKDGVMLFEPEHKKKGVSIVSMDSIVEGSIFRGKVTGAYPDRIYVNVAPGCDVLCNVPKNIYQIFTEDMVLVKIIHKYTTTSGTIRLKGAILSKDYKTLTPEEIEKIKEEQKNAK